MIADFQSMMLPALELMADGRERRHADLFENLGTRFALTDEDLKELLPSGSHPRFEHRIRWAKWYLTRAGLLEGTGHGVFRISAAGQAVLEGTPTGLSLVDLEPMLGQRTDASVPDVDVGAETLEEALASAFESLNRQLSQELLARMRPVHRGSSSVS